VSRKYFQLTIVLSEIVSLRSPLVNVSMAEPSLGDTIDIDIDCDTDTREAKFIICKRSSMHLKATITQTKSIVYRKIRWAIAARTQK